MVDQFRRFAASFARVDEPQARVSKFPIALPMASQLFPRATFDARKVFAVHAQGIADAVLGTFAHAVQAGGAQRYVPELVEVLARR